MRRTWLLVVALIIPMAFQPAPEPSDPATDEAAIRSVLQGLETTWNAGDLDANAEYIDSDMVSLPPGEAPVQGEATNRQRWEELLATMYVEWHPVPEQIWVSGDLAVAWGRATSLVGPKGADLTEYNSKHVWAFRRGSDGVWRMLLESWSEDSTSSQLNTSSTETDEASVLAFLENYRTGIGAADVNVMRDAIASDAVGFFGNGSFSGEQEFVSGSEDWFNESGY